MGSRVGHPLDAAEVERLRALIARDGERKVIQSAGTSSVTVFRALAGLPLYPGSRLMLRNLLARDGAAMKECA